MKKIFIFLALTVSVAAAGYVYFTQTPEAELAKAECVKSCKNALQTGQNISNGPCLSDKIIENWVCDVAHNPREPIDNLPENQCPAFQKTSFRFVEVDPNCNFIRTG